jgi:hypothetical protein
MTRVSRSPAARRLAVHASPCAVAAGASSSSSSRAGSIGRGEQAAAESCVERVADQGVRPRAVPGQGGQHDAREPRVGVDAGGPRAVNCGRQRRRGAAGGEPAQQVRRPGMPSEVPDDPAGWQVLQPQHGRIGGQIPHGEGAGDREAVRQPVAQVRAVEVGLGVPGDEGGGPGTQVRGDREPQRRPLVSVDDLDEEGERTDLSGAGPGGPGDEIASRGGDRRPVVREHRGRRGQDGRVRDAEAGGGEGGELFVLHVGRAQERPAWRGKR